MSRRVGYQHPSAIIGERAESRDATQDAGWYVHEDATIEAGATVDSGTIQQTRVDADAWLFKHSHVGHDAHVMEGAEVSTGAVVGGHAIIGPHAKIGINATILPWKVIGRRARIGAGAVVTHDVPPGETWAGNPARKMEPKRAVRRRHSMYGEAWHGPIPPGVEEALSSSEPEPITRPTPSRPATSTSPASPTPNSAPETPSPATDADELWWEWLARRDTSAKRTTLPVRPPGGFIEASGQRAAKSAPSRHNECLSCWKTDPSHLLCAKCPALGFYP